MIRAFTTAVFLVSSIVPLEAPAALAERLVVVPNSNGKSCVDLDSRWGVGAILAWKQRVCGSGEGFVWVQTDCSQDFAQNGYWIATSTDGLNFERKVKYKSDEIGSTVAQFVCFTVGR